MASRHPEQCFLVMPFGSKPLNDGSGRLYDFDKVPAPHDGLLGHLFFQFTALLTGAVLARCGGSGFEKAIRGR